MALISIGILAITVAYQTMRESSHLIGNLLAKPFMYFTSSLFFFGTLRLFYLLEGTGFVIVSETVLELWGHIPFYLGMVLFIIGLVKMRNFAKNVDQLKTVIGGIRKVEYAGLALVMLVWFGALFSFFFLNEPITRLTEGTLFDHRTGFIHFVAFLVGGITAVVLYETKKEFNIRSWYLNQRLFLAGITALTSIHFWELLTESWNILVVTDSIIGLVESGLAILGVLLLIGGYWKFRTGVREVF